MDLAELGQKLARLLEQQIGEFARATALQIKINTRLRDDRDPSIVLEDLRSKEQVLDLIKARNEEFRPYIAEWMQVRFEAQTRPEWNLIMGLLDQLDRVVVDLKMADEEMITLVQKREESHSDPTLLIHAFRALS